MRGDLTVPRNLGHGLTPGPVSREIMGVATCDGAYARVLEHGSPAEPASFLEPHLARIAAREVIVRP
ncbi:MAG TPA: hypothetical protein VFK02_08925 [Kofleriaceae bacterium]|nr:hypothetical protein [Kofleriaceae bacterium]